MFLAIQVSKPTSAPPSKTHTSAVIVFQSKKRAIFWKHFILLFLLFIFVAPSSGDINDIKCSTRQVDPFFTCGPKWSFRRLVSWSFGRGKLCTSRAPARWRQRRRSLAPKIPWSTWTLSRGEATVENGVVRSPLFWIRLMLVKEDQGFWLTWNITNQLDQCAHFSSFHLCHLSVVTSSLLVFINPHVDFLNFLHAEWKRVKNAGDYHLFGFTGRFKFLHILCNAFNIL